MIYEFCKDVAVGPLVKAAYRFKVEGREHVPVSGPAIFASNHLGFADSIFLPLALPRRITFPAKMEYFTGKGIKGWVQKTFFTTMGQIPIDRSGGAASTKAMEAGLEVLARGEFFGIYPEGTRSPDGRLYKGKTGVVRMALQSGAPVIPVAMIGTEKVQPGGQALPHLVPVTVRFGTPFDFSDRAHQLNDHLALRAMTDQVMEALRDLSGQEYVPDVYAADLKKQLAAAGRPVLGVSPDEVKLEAEAPREDMVDPAPGGGPAA